MIRIVKTDYLMHYGTKGHSGRYPPGSGKNPKTGPRAKMKKLGQTPAKLVTTDMKEYNRYVMTNDYKIPKGAVLTRVGDANRKFKGTDDELLYTTLFKSDFTNYIDAFGIANQDVIKYKLNKDIKLASGDKILEYVMQKDGYTKFLDEYKKTDRSSLYTNTDEWLNQKGITDIIDSAYPNMTKSEKEKTFRRIGEISDVMTSPYRNDIIKEFKKRGYDGCADPVDTLDRVSFSPTILFTPKTICKKTKAYKVNSKKWKQICNTAANDFFDDKYTWDVDKSQQKN